MEEKELDLIGGRTPISIGRDRTTGEKVYIYLDLEDIAVVERAETVYKRLNTIMDDIKAPPKKNASDDETLTYVADIIRKANKYAKQAIDEVFDEPVAEKIWGNSSCISFGEDANSSRFGKTIAALLDLYEPAVEAMANKAKEQSDAFVSEVLDEGDNQP